MSILQAHLVIQCSPIFFDSDDDNPITGHSGNPFIGNPNNPFTQQQVRGHVPLQTTVDTDATTIIGNTMSAVASEFKKNEGAQVS